MKFPTAIALAISCMVASPALAQQQDSRTYFTARLFERPAPQQLSAADREYYDSVFTALSLIHI